jgi:transcriptional regulator
MAPEARMGTEPLDLLQGTLDVLVLKTLSWQPMHGYAVSRWIRERTTAAILVEDAALYQALHRLERRGWVAGDWGLSENNRRAKFYRLTPQGRQQLRREVSTWHRYAAAVSAVLDAASPDAPPTVGAAAPA